MFLPDMLTSPKVTTALPLLVMWYLYSTTGILRLPKLLVGLPTVLRLVYPYVVPKLTPED